MKILCPNCGQWINPPNLAAHRLAMELDEISHELKIDGITNKNLAARRLEQIARSLKNIEIKEEKQNGEQC